MLLLKRKKRHDNKRKLITTFKSEKFFWVKANNILNSEDKQEKASTFGVEGGEERELDSWLVQLRESDVKRKAR